MATPILDVEDDRGGAKRFIVNTKPSRALAAAGFDWSDWVKRSAISP